MSSCPPCQPRELPAPLKGFHSKLQDPTNATLTGDKRRWLHEKGFGRHLGYVHRACVYEHVEALKARKSRAKVRRPRPRPLGSKHALRHRWAAEDARIDLSEAIGRLEPHQRLAVRMRRDNYGYADIANALGVSERQAHRVVKEPFRKVRGWLGEDYLQAA